MKIRNGFVSNSSSSSFIISKAYINEKQIEAILDFHKAMNDAGSYFGEGGNYLTNEECYIQFEMYNIYREFKAMLDLNGIEKRYYLIIDG